MGNVCKSCGSINVTLCVGINDIGEDWNYIVKCCECCPHDHGDDLHNILLTADLATFTNTTLSA